MDGASSDSPSSPRCPSLACATCAREPGTVREWGAAHYERRNWEGARSLSQSKRSVAPLPPYTPLSRSAPLPRGTRAT